jgi:hypothetical protein
MRFESRRGQNEKKMTKKKRILQFERMYFLYYSFWTGGLLALHFKDDFVELEKVLL